MKNLIKIIRELTNDEKDRLKRHDIYIFNKKELINYLFMYCIIVLISTYGISYYTLKYFMEEQIVNELKNRCKNNYAVTLNCRALENVNYFNPKEAYIGTNETDNFLNITNINISSRK